MDNIFLIATNDKVTIDNEINKLKNKYPDAELVYYDLLEVPIDRVIEDLDTYNFLSNKKIIIGTNASFLSSDRTKSIVEHNLEKLEKYIDNPSADNILVLVCDHLDKRKKLTSNLCNQANIIEELSDIHSLIKNRLDNYQMDNNAEKLLLEYCRDEHERVFNEIEKLKLYKSETKVITSEDIEKLVIKKLDDNIFHLIDSILTGNKKYAFTLYQDFILHGEQIVNIIRILSSKIRLIYQVKVLIRDGNSDKAISKLLKVHEYSVKLAREASYKYSDEVLLQDLKKLADLDLQIKSGETNGQVEFETLLAVI